MPEAAFARTPAADPATVLKLKDLQAWYNESHILHGVDLDVREGELVTLLGRNGAGKTTTLKSIMGIVGKRSGSITFRDRELINLSIDRIARLGVALSHVGPNAPHRSPAAMTTRGGPAAAAACDQPPETGSRTNVSGDRLLGWIPSSLEDIRHLRRGGCSVVRRARKALPANPPIRWRPIYLGFWYDSIVGKRWDGMVRGCRIGATDS